MFKDIDEFENFLETGWHWGIKEHTFYCYRVVLSDGSFDYVGVPEEVLASYHRDFPNTMRAMMAHQEELDGNGATLSAANVFATYKNLTSGIPSVCSEDGLCTHVWDVEDFYEAPDNTDVMVLEVIEVSFAYRRYQVTDATFVVSESPSAVRVLKSELDDEHPGWRQRWDSGQALGLTGMDLAKYLLDKNLTPSAAIEGIEF